MYLFIFHACHLSWVRVKPCCQCNLNSHYYLQWESIPQITGYLVISGTSVKESACNVFLCCTGRWLRWTSTLSSTSDIRIGGSIVKTCQLGGWCVTNHWLHNTSWHMSWDLETSYITIQLWCFVCLGFCSCNILKVCTTRQLVGNLWHRDVLLGISQEEADVLILWIILNPLPRSLIHVGCPG